MKDVFVIAPLVMALWVLGVAAYLWLFHGEVPLKELGSTAFAATIGTFVGRSWGRRSMHG